MCVALLWTFALGSRGDHESLALLEAGSHSDLQLHVACDGVAPVTFAIGPSSNAATPVAALVKLPRHSSTGAIAPSAGSMRRPCAWHNEVGSGCSPCSSAHAAATST